PLPMRPSCAQQTCPAMGQSVGSSQRTFAAESGQLPTDVAATQRAAAPSGMQQNSVGAEQSVLPQCRLSGWPLSVPASTPVTPPLPPVPAAPPPPWPPFAVPAFPPAPPPIPPV